MEPQTCFVYKSQEFIPLLEGIGVSPLMKTKPTTQPIAIPVPGVISALENLSELCVSDTLYCTYCATGFIDKHQQRAHYKLDWHRYNLKQHLASRKTVSEEKFTQLADDVSSISGSESENDDGTDCSSTDVESSNDDAMLTHLIASTSRILFNNARGEVISIHRALFLRKKEEAASDDHLVKLVNTLPYRTNWLIIMMGGGHFAAAIFKGEQAIFHKTFHSYTVRAKQGGSQSSKDGKGSHSKSAGASLRRYNEQSFSQHIQDLMKSWAPDIVKCDMIFYRAVGPTNSGILFNGPVPLLLRADPRLRTIPFPTRRATFNELNRVHSLLTTAFIYDSNEMFRTTFMPLNKEPTDSEKKWLKCGEGSPKNSPQKIDRAKERPSPVRELPDIVQQLAAISTSGSEGDLVLVEEEISFVDSLQEFDDTVRKNAKASVVKRKHRKKKKELPKTEEMEPRETFRPEVEELWKNIHSSCLNGNDEGLKVLLENEEKPATGDEVSVILNQKNILGETILHNMAAQAKCDIVRLLMLHGADPTLRDKKSQTPYDHASDKQTRNIFRRFMGEFPDKFDFSKSHIPNPLTEELESEISEKRRLAKKAKRQKDKERKVAAETMKKEDYDKKCFLNLSDREKRALAAERRILAASGKRGVVLSRCYSCAIDITGNVPFEYDSNRFCTIDCLKKHRSRTKKES